MLKQPATLRTIRDYLLLTIGSVCLALALDIFLVPNNVIAGGLMGVAQMIHTLTGAPVGVSMLVLNIPLFALGWRYLGGVTFGVRTFYATVILSVAIDLLNPLVAHYRVDDPLLYVFYGGLLDGVGTGLVFRARGTTGGVDIIAAFLREWRGIRSGQGLLLVSAIIFALAGLVYGPIPVLYALLVAFIAARAVDIVLEGYSYARSAIIISKYPDAVRAAVLQKLGRGVTVLEGEGGYRATAQPVLLVVVSRSEISTLKVLVSDIDPAAFVVIAEAMEVLGEGFKALLEPGQQR